MLTFWSKFLTFPFCDSKHVALFIFWLWFFDEAFQYQWIVRSWRQWQGIRTSSGGIFMWRQMGCIVTNVTVHMWRQKTLKVTKTHRCCQVRTDTSFIASFCKTVLESRYKIILTNQHLYEISSVQKNIYLRLLIAFGWLCFRRDIPEWTSCLCSEISSA